MASNLQVVILTILFIGTMGMVIYTVSDMLDEIRKEEKHELSSYSKSKGGAKK